MRLGVLDVGSNTVHLIVFDAYHGAAPRSAYSYKTELRLAELIDEDGRIGDDGAEALITFVTQAGKVAEEQGADELLAFATSAIREAPNGDDVLTRVRDRSGVELEVLSGREEARLTFLAARRWFGWSRGRLLVFDIGGGSLEVATGTAEEPDGAFSLPLGAGRLTREWISGDPPSPSSVKKLRKHVRAELASHVTEIQGFGVPSHVVGTSKTMRQLARITGAAPSSAGPYVPRFVPHSGLVDWLPRMIKMTTSQRADLPGVSLGRAGQIVAGAVVADAVMDLFRVERLEVCPWALREGVILRRLDMLER